jgi:hypothetical protein
MVGSHEYGFQVCNSTQSYIERGRGALGTRIRKKLSGVLATAALATVLVGVAPAHAASTRAEYIGQVDPICQASVAPINAAKTAYTRNYKRWIRGLSHGTLKSWVKQTGRTARSLSQLNLAHAALTNQIAAVQPLTSDAGTIGTWLNDRRQAEGFAASAATAFSRFKFDRFDKQLRRAGTADAAGVMAIAGFGFQVCGVSA